MAELAITLEAPPPHSGIRVLVVDKDNRIRATLLHYLTDFGCEVVATETTEGALNAVERCSFELAILDPRVGQEGGLDLAARLLAEAPGLAVVLLAACSPLRPGGPEGFACVCEHLPECFTPRQLRHLVDRVAGNRSLRNRLTSAEAGMADAASEANIVAGSPAMRTVVGMLSRAARSDAPVLLRGERGSGKSVLARFLHAHSSRSSRPFVVANCAGIPEQRMAGDIFGDAYGVPKNLGLGRQGCIEAAEGGSLFLEEIGAITPSVQARLQHFLQDKTFERWGETRSRRADVRIVASSAIDLRAAIAAGTLSEGLLYHLNVIEIEVPPLRDRREDILPLARMLLERFSRRSRRGSPGLTGAAQSALTAYAWPGNVRELRNAIEHAFIRCSEAPAIDASDLPAHVTEGCDTVVKLGGHFTLATIEREHIRLLVERTGGIKEAAKILGVAGSTLWRKRKTYGPSASPG